MARIRTIKPELRRSLTVASWPRQVRYAWVLLFGYLDDYGRGLDDLRLLKSDMFPLDRDVTERKLDGWLDLMADTKDEDDMPALCRYVALSGGGGRYLHAPKWHRHQKINRSRKSVHPPCPIHDEEGNEA